MTRTGAEGVDLLDLWYSLPAILYQKSLEVIVCNTMHHFVQFSLCAVFVLRRFVTAPFLSSAIYASAVFAIRRLCCAVYSAPFLSTPFIPRIGGVFMEKTDVSIGKSF